MRWRKYERRLCISYGFTGENVCRQAHRVLDKNKEEGPCALESPQTMEGSF